MIEVSQDIIAVDTEKDLENVRKLIAKKIKKNG